MSEDKVREATGPAVPPPPERASHWTLRALAKRLGIAVSTVFGILKRNGLKPHRVKTFKVSRDPGLGLKVLGAVGLYVNPPDNAVIIPADGKTQTQAVGRTQKLLPMKPGHPETGTRDHKRNGTACLMAALDVAAGKVTGRMAGRHRSEKFLAFLDLVSEGIKPGAPVQVILDNVSSHKSAEVSEWLKDRKNWTFHFTPAPASWMNAVEGFFSKLSRQRLRHAIFNSVDECIAAIEGHIEHHNANDARPFRWSRKPEDLAEAWKKGHQKLQELAS